MGSARSAVCGIWIAASFGCTNAKSTTIVVETAEQDSGAAELPDSSPSIGDRDAGASTDVFTLTSSALKEGESFDAKYTCDGEDISPPLSWINPPRGTKSFALLLTDLDFRVFGDPGPFVHWAIFNIPQAFRALPENVGVGPMPVNVPGASQVRAWSALGGAVGGNHYLGPCTSEVHRYELALVALDVETLEGLDTSKQPREVSDRLDTLEHVLGVATLVAPYARLR